MGPAMAPLAGVKPETGHRAGERRLSWPVFLLMLAAVTCSSLSAYSLYQLVALRAEVEGLKLEVCRRREEGQEAKHGGQVKANYPQTENVSSRQSSQEPFPQAVSRHILTVIRNKRQAGGTETSVSHPCLQLLADKKRQTFSKGIPWQVGLRRGSALEPRGDRILVREEGFFFVYSQVFYMDSTFAMGHVVVRWKSNVVGNDDPHAILFRCIQSMNPASPFNTCYTGGIVKLEAGDHLELLIPRPTANVSLDGDVTFLGALKLA
ncbi:tumor necrosis factor ligand superfamily member 13B isoform X2 [Echeneis naucrates]|uniref:tumor necrosis factor ligand superfamily member 13B isoform X2 n=1 Tax=Echeneis naucrates TaxID=173247 RepID=UPI00111426FB|nr:tumor necrosis factor ligand superfamily member 13B isoform X2 [Echeneis naucrates]